MLLPSATIAVGYSTTVIRTKSGDMLQGIIKESNDQSVGLMGSDGKLVRIKTSDIDRQQTTDVSLMPEGLEGALTQQQFADLIAYLASLKAPQSTAAASHGMPAEIPVLKTPVVLEQINSAGNAFKHPVWFGAVPGLADTFAVMEHEEGTIWLCQKNGSTETKTKFLETIAMPCLERADWLAWSFIRNSRRTINTTSCATPPREATFPARSLKEWPPPI